MKSKMLMTLNIFYVSLGKKNYYVVNGTMTQFLIFINSHSIIIEITLISTLGFSLLYIK